MKRTLITTALLAGSLFAASDLDAQVSKASGFMLNAHLTGTSLTTGEGENESEDNGGGLGLVVGYGFTDRLAVYLAIDGSSMKPDGEEGEEYALGQADLGIRYTFGSTASALRPYVNAALNGTAITDEVSDEGQTFDVTISGGGLTLGGGVQYFFSPSLALDVALQGSAGTLSTLEIDGEEIDLEDEEVDFSAGRLQLGITWHP